MRYDCLPNTTDSSLVDLMLSHPSALGFSGQQILVCSTREQCLVAFHNSWISGALYAALLLYCYGLLSFFFGWMRKANISRQ